MSPIRTDALSVHFIGTSLQTSCPGFPSSSAQCLGKASQLPFISSMGNLFTSPGQQPHPQKDGSARLCFGQEALLKEAHPVSCLSGTAERGVRQFLSAAHRQTFKALSFQVERSLLRSFAACRLEVAKLRASRISY